MSSKVLYPPVVDSYMPAFKAGSSSCRVYFSLSKFNSSSDFSSVHATVVKQNTGMNVVKTTDSNGRYRSTGIILNLKATKVTTENNLYYIEIENDDLKSISGSYSGWIPGWIYKIQIRLSSVDYDGTSMGQAAWLNSYAGSFSEWSTICIVKATGQIDYDIPILNIDTRDTNSSSGGSSSKVLFLSTLELFGHFYREEDPSELIKNYQFILYDNNDTVLEDTGKILLNQYQDNDSFNYTFKTELQDQHAYKLAFIYETINYYINGFYQTETKDNRVNFVVSQSYADPVNCHIITAENDPDMILEGITSVHEEEEEGRIGLKLFSSNTDPFGGNLCIRRSDSRSNFSIWEDIKIIVVKNQNINTLDIFYDYTAESGVWYKYGVQIIESDGTRGILIQTPAIIRNYNYSFLLGQNNQQLKLMFDNNMSSFKYQIQDSVSDTIGGTYPVITRNAAVKYRTFPIEGLITFWMDEKEVFTNKKIIYDYNDVVDLYNQYNRYKNISQYDYIYERDFRQKVLDFLQDGELKLFKSPTEGNIIVRLTDINCTPIQSLDRLIYSFGANAYEMAKANMENYLKYNFYEIGDYESSFGTYETKIGQIIGEYPANVDIIKEIYNKYDGQGRNYGGYIKNLKNIHHIKITFDGSPLRIINSANEYVLGHNFSLNGKIFTVYDPINQYEFDDNLIYTPTDSLIILGDAENTNVTIPIVVDFLYDIENETYQEKQIQSQENKIVIGQLYGNYNPDINLYNEITYKYYIEYGNVFRRLNSISSIDIEAEPGTIFNIQDAADDSPQQYEINKTGRLYLDNLNTIIGISYIGMRDESKEDKIDHTKNADIVLNYIATIISGTYKKET